MHREETIRIFTTGGTIDKIYFDSKSTFEVGEPQVAELLKEANLSLKFEVESLLRKDSLDLTNEDRVLIRCRVEADPRRLILITHGTDTMIQTALALGAIAGKVIVLTGSMQPARFRKTDALFNIASAVTALQLLPEGVWIAMNGRIFDPHHSRKNIELNRFEEI